MLIQINNNLFCDLIILTVLCSEYRLKGYCRFIQLVLRLERVEHDSVLENDEIKIKLVLDDPELKIISELYAIKSSKKVIDYITNKSAHKAEISKETGVSYDTVEHILKKLDKVNNLEITKKKLIRKGKFHNSYQCKSSNIFILKEAMLDPLDQILKKIFKNNVKIV